MPICVSDGACFLVLRRKNSTKMGPKLRLHFHRADISVSPQVQIDFGSNLGPIVEQEVIFHKRPLQNPAVQDPGAEFGFARLLRPSKRIVHRVGAQTRCHMLHLHATICQLRNEPLR